MRHYELLIGGHFVGGPCDQSVSKITSRNPWNGQTIGTAAEASVVEAQAAIDSAVSAFLTWKDSNRQQRSDLLKAISDEIRTQASILTELLVLEVGKPVVWAEAEVERTAITFGLAAEAALTLSPKEIDVSYDKRALGHSVMATRFPIGPILCITPYNWPYNLAAHKIAPALAAGNTVIVKGSQQAALCTLALARVIKEAGCPDGVVNVIIADPRTSGRIANHPQVPMISFTGSPAVGWDLKKEHATKRVTLELGGNAFAVLCEDAAIDTAVAKLAMSGYGYAGQICISTQHVLVHESIYELVKDKLTFATRACVGGDPMDRSTVCGPLISQEAAERVEKMVNEAMAAGAHLLAGGSRNGAFYSPTLLENVPQSATLAQVEVFGPVMTITPYHTLEDAIQRINSSQFGLQSAVFTSQQEVVQDLYRRLEVGSLIVNEPPSLRFDAMPYGGVKQSGFGREGVDYAIDDMTEWKTLVRL